MKDKIVIVGLKTLLAIISQIGSRQAGCTSKEIIIECTNNYKKYLPAIEALEKEGVLKTVELDHDD